MWAGRAEHAPPLCLSRAPADYHLPSDREAGTTKLAATDAGYPFAASRACRIAFGQGAGTKALGLPMVAGRNEKAENVLRAAARGFGVDAAIPVGWIGEGNSKGCAVTSPAARSPTNV